MDTPRIAIIGAGLSGSLLAVYLARKGFEVAVYERRPDMRREEVSAGRSINLALSTRGIYALQEVGVKDAIMTDAIPMRGRMIHPLEGELSFQPYGKNEREVINSISRGTLNCRLMDAAEATGLVKIFFDERCMDVDLNAGELLFRNEINGLETPGETPSDHCLRRCLLRSSLGDDEVRPIQFFTGLPGSWV